MVSAVLFAKDLRRVATFYVRVFAVQVLQEDAHHAELDCSGFRLVVHQIPEQFARNVVVTTPPHRREHGAIRLNFPVRDVPGSRALARSLGGEIDDQPPPWAGGDTSFHLGHDPEGNVFGAQSA
ncbi:MAG TPA: VOC family protein [Steroidobacteraceae bacterium]|jgi:predicted enzyme related to lactoylglutathione lyase